MNEIKHGYFIDGELRFKHLYYQGQFHGICKGWYKNGQLRYEEPYHEGHRHGIVKMWYENKELKNKRYFLYGKKVTEKEYRRYELIEQLACLE